MLPSVSTPVRSRGRAATESAILRSAWTLWSGCGPDGLPLREVTAGAGCSHTLVARYFGSKQGLVEAVAALVATRVDRAVRDAWSTDGDPLEHLLATAREDPVCTRLVVRCGLGDLPSTALLPAFHLEQLSGLVGARPGAAGRRRLLLAYGAASMLLGWLTFEDFLVAATEAGRVPPAHLDAGVAAQARSLVDLGRSSRPQLRPRRIPPGPSPAGPAGDGARERLLVAAVALLAERGPASVSLRDVARRAGVNLGLIHRHFGSRDALVAAALEQGSLDLYPGAAAAAGFDLDAVSRVLHAGSPAPVLIARTSVDGIPITRVRPRFPVVAHLLATYPEVPTGAGPGHITDPRVRAIGVAALALGSAIWGAPLRAELGLPDAGTDAAVADLARVLLRPG